MSEKDGDRFLRELAKKALERERVQTLLEGLLHSEPQTLEEWVEQERN